VLSSPGAAPPFLICRQGQVLTIVSGSLRSRSPRLIETTLRSFVLHPQRWQRPSRSSTFEIAADISFTPRRGWHPFGEACSRKRARPVTRDGHFVDRERVRSAGLAITTRLGEAERGAVSRRSPHPAPLLPQAGRNGGRAHYALTPPLDRNDSSPFPSAAAAPEQCGVEASNAIGLDRCGCSILGAFPKFIAR